MSSLSNEIIGYIAEQLSKHSREWVVEALGKVEPVNALEGLMLSVAQRFVEEHGAEVAADKIADVASAILLKGNDAYNIDKLDLLTAAELSVLAEELQQAEAVKRRKAKRYAKTLGAALKASGIVLVDVAKAVIL